jgi:integrase
MSHADLLDLREAKKIRRRAMGCKVKVNQHGFLAFHLFWNKNRSWEGTGLRDTAENRRLVEAKAVLIGREIKKGTFDYLKWFPEGNRAEQFRPKEEPPKTVGEFYRGWIERKKPPFVRPGLHYDYTRQFRRYILPKFEETLIVEVTLPLLEAFRSYLNQEMGLSLKSCRNIIDGTFRAMMRDARKHGIGDKDCFADLEWPRIVSPKPDPFNVDERDSILKHFKEKHTFYYPFLSMLFGTGARPSEIIALRWGDVDLKSGVVSISKSRYRDTDSPTKTVASEREIAIGEPIIALLKEIKPLHVTENDFVFKNQEGNPIIEDKWRAKYWYRALRACGVRARKFYATRHTFISVALTRGVKIKWLAEYCGTSVAMIEKHYGKYLDGDSKEQLQKLFEAKSETFSETLDKRVGIAEGQVANKFGGSDWSGRVDLNHRLHGPEPCALPS